jgi:hypothetical protein
MSLKPEISNINELRKNTRVILEKLKDLCFGNKFESILDKRKIMNPAGMNPDTQVYVQLCIYCVSDNYRCFLDSLITSGSNSAKKFKSLQTALTLLNEEIDLCLKSKKPKPLKKRFVSNVLRAHTKFFNTFNAKIDTHKCSDLYDKLRMASVAVWNNRFGTTDSDLEQTS